MQSIVNCEAIKRFCNKYVELIGTGVVDDVFDAPLSSKSSENGLTRVRVGTELIRRFFYVPITKAIRTNDNRKLLKMLEYLLKILTEVIGLNVGKEWTIDHRLGYSYGNDKLGAGILTINLSPAFLCPSMCLGYCNHCSDCYAMKSEIRHESELVRNILNFIKILKYPIEDISRDTIKALGNKKQTLRLEFVRFSANGDILNNDILIKANTLAMDLLARYQNLLGVYTYTHNKNLDLSLATHMVVNQSDNDSDGVKATIVLFKWEDKYFDPTRYVLCLGDCTNCPYCKNEQDKRTVIFMAHGGGLNAMETVPQGVIAYFELMLHFYNNNFLEMARNQRAKA